MNLWPLILIVCAGCAVSSPTSSQPLASGDSFAQQEMITPAAVYHRAVAWDYPEAMPPTNIAFDVEGSTDLIDWGLIETTNQSPAVWDSFNPTEYIRVGAHWIIDTNL